MRGIPTLRIPDQLPAVASTRLFCVFYPPTMTASIIILALFAAMVVGVLIWASITS